MTAYICMHDQSDKNNGKQRIIDFLLVINFIAKNDCLGPTSACMIKATKITVSNYGSQIFKFTIGKQD